MWGSRLLEKKDFADILCLLKTLCQFNWQSGPDCYQKYVTIWYKTLFNVKVYRMRLKDKKCYVCFFDFSKACLFASAPHNVEKIDLKVKSN